MSKYKNKISRKSLNKIIKEKIFSFHVKAQKNIFCCARQVPSPLPSLSCIPKFFFFSFNLLLK
ncbi:unnamed protein product [Meloidogyne enterolobii]|uniref:Uncharacterized protein n=1 Tax=Meloidogyne enterolobii TaxID=390850 RepID=A0ACB0XR59_MELEN